MKGFEGKNSKKILGGDTFQKKKKLIGTTGVRTQAPLGSGA